MSNNNEYINTFIEKGIFEPKLDILRDFMFLLMSTLNLSYLGDDLMDSDRVKSQHFHWAITKIIKVFAGRGIIISNSRSFEDFFYNIYNSDFYLKGKDEKTIDNFYKKYGNILSINPNMKMDVFRQLESIYNIFDSAMGTYS